MFGENRRGFRPWHDKFVNAISQHFKGVRELFQEMKTQLVTKKYGLTLAEWQQCWDKTKVNLGPKINDQIQFDKFNEFLYYILTEKTEGDAAVRVKSVEPGQGFEAYHRVYLWFSSTFDMALNKRMDG